ncbi:MAG: VTT domain-containing protein [Polycyclovorans sp.]|jgi:uncharacterized membrane protein YdjX (TVP38/TMEM64 family)|nr:VTT domain-containing protein [Gammaproteobacteria bacterium]|tara:strand:- start:3149 stop:3832 length:684 start_codon:yes stop_codon:yes gene_type:complete
MMAGRRRTWLIWLLALAVVLAFGALWRFTPLGEWTQPEKVAAQIETLTQSPWAPLTLGLIYLAATAVMFPIIALNLALMVALGPLWGVLAALYGTLLAGLAAYWIGRSFGSKPLRGLATARVERALTFIRNSGLPGMILLRLVPVAPYPVINLMLGAGGIGLWVFLAGTALGVLPSLLVMGVLGFQLTEVINDPSAANIGFLVALVLACVALGWWVKRRLPSQVEET